MSNNGIKTRAPVAEKAGKLLKKSKDKTTRSVAGSDLSNAKQDTKRKNK